MKPIDTKPCVHNTSKMIFTDYYSSLFTVGLKYTCGGSFGKKGLYYLPEQKMVYM